MSDRECPFGCGSPCIRGASNPIYECGTITLNGKDRRSAACRIMVLEGKVLAHERELKQLRGNVSRIYQMRG